MSCIYNTFRGICYDEKPLTCSQTSRTVSGSFCNGGGYFSTVAPSYSCNVPASRTTVTSPDCYLQPLAYTCSSSPTSSYATATITRVALVTADSGCYSPLTDVHTYYEVITFKAGTVNGVSPDGGVSSTVIIIIAVGAGILLIIAAVVGYLVFKNKRKKQMQQQPVAPAMYAPPNAVPMSPYQNVPPPMSPYSTQQPTFTGQNVYSYQPQQTMMAGNPYGAVQYPPSDPQKMYSNPLMAPSTIPSSGSTAYSNTPNATVTAPENPSNAYISEPPKF
ncbi:hypothetical protein HK098_008231 [Nowakowskiella sp. JEL0407]|nr:hypothetical protein HK098_008231 [Nowakowskiella sp. JEL0407]